jgi:hypothetical protein
MAAHWHEDGYLVAIPFVLLVYPATAWVLIFRANWADKFSPFFRITSNRGKVIGGIMLIGMVLALADIADHFIPRR